MRQQVVGVHAQVAEHLLEFVPKARQPFGVVLLVQGEVDVTVGVERDPVVGVGKILTAEPEVHRVMGQHLEGKIR